MGVIVWKVTVGRRINELGLLYTRNNNFLAVQQGPELTAAVLNAVTVEL